MKVPAMIFEFIRSVRVKLIPKSIRSGGYHNTKAEIPCHGLGRACFSVAILLPLFLTIPARPTPRLAPRSPATKQEDGRSAKGIRSAFPVLDVTFSAEKINDFVERFVKQSPGCFFDKLEITMASIANQVRVQGTLKINKLSQTLPKQTLDSLDLDKMDNHFDLLLEFRSHTVVSATGALGFEVISFKMAGVDLTKLTSEVVMPLVGQLINLLDFKKLLVILGRDDLDVTINKNNEYVASGTISHLGEMANYLRVVNNTFYVRPNIAAIANGLTSDLALNDNYRLWFFGPTSNLQCSSESNGKIHCTDGFRVEIGVGLPMDIWRKSEKNRSDLIRDTVKEYNQEDYGRFGGEIYFRGSNLNGANEAFYNDITQSRGTRNYVELSDFAKNELRRFQAESRARAETILDPDQNKMFFVDPQAVYTQFLKELEQDQKQLLAHIERLEGNLQKSRSGYPIDGVQNLPIANKLLSQKALDAIVNYYSYFEIKEGLVMTDPKIVISPQTNGLIVRGELAISGVNDILSLLDENSLPALLKVLDFNADKIVLDKIPFEGSFNVTSRPDGKLALMISRLSLFDSNFHLQARNQNQVFLNFLTKIVEDTIAKQLLAIEIPGKASNLNPSQQLDQVKYHIQSVFSNSKQLQNINQILESDISLNRTPGVEANSSSSGKTVKIDFKKLINLEPDGTLILNVDPRPFGEMLPVDVSNLKLWNFSPIYLSEANKTFLDLAVGMGNRSQRFSSALLNKKSYQEQGKFAGTDGARDEGNLDLRLSLPINAFSLFMSQFFEGARAKSQENPPPQVTENHFEITKLTLDINEQDELILNALFELQTPKGVVSKAMGKAFGVFSRKGKNGSVTEINVTTLPVKMALKARVVDSSILSEVTTKSSNESFLGNNFLELDIKRVDLSGGESSSLIFDLIAKAAGVAAALTPIEKAKAILFKFIGPYVHSATPPTNGNIRFGTLPLNQYAKVLMSKSKIYVHLNPRLLLPAFDLNLIPATSGDGLSPLTVNGKEREVNLDFAVATRMAIHHKKRIQKWAEDLDDLMKVLLDSKTDAALFLRQLMNRSEFGNRQRSNVFDFIVNRGSWPQIVKIRNLYDGITGPTSPKDSLSNSQSQFQVSLTGVELTYFLAAALKMADYVDLLLAKVDSLNAASVDQTIDQRTVRENFEIFKDCLQTKWIVPLYEKYGQSFHKLSRQVVTEGLNDWNHLYYADAFSAETIYSFAFDKVKKIGERSQTTPKSTSSEQSRRDRALKDICR